MLRACPVNRVRLTAAPYCTMTSTAVTDATARSAAQVGRYTDGRFAREVERL